MMTVRCWFCMSPIHLEKARIIRLARDGGDTAAICSKPGCQKSADNCDKTYGEPLISAQEAYMKWKKEKEDEETKSEVSGA
jgi:hypothetical protein